MIKLLLIEDEHTLAGIIRDTLNDNGFSVDLAYNGEQGLEHYNICKPDIIVTDIMMPLMDGFTLIEKIRKNGDTLPILFLSARSAAEDVVRGFELGCNDYIRKPFAMSELIIRIKALLGHRHNQDTEECHIWEIGQYTFDNKTNLLHYKETNPILAAVENPCKLSTRESQVLTYLCKHKEEIVANKTILLDIWGDDSFFNGRSLHVYITKLRHKFAADPSITIINIRGTGYKLMVI